MTTALLAGAALGGALYLLVLAVAPPRRSLAAAVGRWEAGRSRTLGPSTSTSVPQQWGARMAAWFARECAKRGIRFTTIRPDLELIGRSLEEHLAKKLLYALGGFLMPAAFVTIMVAGGVSVPWSVPLIVGVGFAVGFFFLPDASVKAKAVEQRGALRWALSCYLVLVSMAMAGGRAVPQALPTAAKLGKGEAFGLIARTVTGARAKDMTPWAALTELGERTRMQELRDLGGALSLVTEDGAKVRASLTARAATLRRRRLAEVEGAAQKANETMSMCSVLLAVTFILFLGYPAAMTVLAI
jgi:tight adherence protein C